MHRPETSPLGPRSSTWTSVLTLSSSPPPPTSVSRSTGWSAASARFWWTTVRCYSFIIAKYKLIPGNIHKPMSICLRWYGTHVNINLETNTLWAKYFHRVLKYSNFGKKYVWPIAPHCQGTVFGKNFLQIILYFFFLRKYATTWRCPLPPYYIIAKDFSARY